MRGRALPIVFALLLSAPAQAQTTWQPTPPPTVTADNEPWFRAGEAIEWNGALYAPAGAFQAFNGFQMVRAGSYRGIPLYIDATVEPNSVLLVPITGGLQPYQRRAVTTAGGLGVTREGFVAQAPGPPMVAAPYDVGGSITGTSGRTAVTVTDRASASVAKPIGLNGVWLNYDGRRWVSAGKAVSRTNAFTQIGFYRGTPVYRRGGDTTTIYVALAGGPLTPFKPR